MKKNYYEILGVDPNISKNDLKKVYRKLTLKYHPDRNKEDKNAEEKFKLIVEAYNVLSNDQSRKEYDESLKKELKIDKTKGKTTTTVRPVYVDPADFRKQFESYFGFNPDTRKKVEKKEKTKVKGNIDTDELFRQYFTGGRKKF
ncbi:MAG: DnaJ domain-containing protein [Halanaerobiaceae bacterium]|nr:DnaJ domain-containing protein [Halanaerobiaceae bacterium]